MRWKFDWLVALWIGWGLQVGLAQESFQSLVKRENFQASVAQLKEQLIADTDHDKLRFQLGPLEFLQALEELGQSWYRFRDRDHLLTDSFLLMRFSVMRNPDPLKVDCEKFRFRGGRASVGEITRVRKKLSAIKSDDVAIEMDLMEIGMDWDGNGQIDKAGRLGKNLAMVFGWRDEPGEIKTLAVRLDRADVYWLRGDCHLLSAFAEFFLAYGHEEDW